MDLPPAPARCCSPGSMSSNAATTRCRSGSTRPAPSYCPRTAAVRRTLAVLRVGGPAADADAGVARTDLPGSGWSPTRGRLPSAAGAHGSWSAHSAPPRYPRSRTAARRPGSTWCRPDCQRRRACWSPASASPTGTCSTPTCVTGLPHLMVRLTEGDAVVGPFVVPGRTACLRCLDAHHADGRPTVAAAGGAAGGPNLPLARRRGSGAGGPSAGAPRARLGGPRPVQPRGRPAPGVVVGHDPATTRSRRGRGCRLAASSRVRLLVERPGPNAAPFRARARQSME